MNKRSGKQSRKKVQPSKEDIEKAKDRLERAKKQLQNAERCWEDETFVRALQEKTPEEKQKAFDLALDTGTKLLMIQNAQIVLVVSRIKRNSKELESAILGLENSLQSLSNVTRILDATGSLLSLVGKILALV